MATLEELKESQDQFLISHCLYDDFAATRLRIIQGGDDASMKDRCKISSVRSNRSGKLTTSKRSRLIKKARKLSNKPLSPCKSKRTLRFMPSTPQTPIELDSSSLQLSKHTSLLNLQPPPFCYTKTSRK
jgi:hypothetical protein